MLDMKGAEHPDGKGVQEPPQLETVHSALRAGKISDEKPDCHSHKAH
jgi:hypothetical protein